MKLRVLSGFLLAGALSCFSAMAEEETPALKVPPVADRPMGEQTNADGSKDKVATSTPPAPAPATTPAPDAAPAEKDAAGSADVPVADTIVPEPFPVSRYASLWENSPFQIESIAPPQQSEGLAQRFVLGGILRENGEPVVWVRERATQQSYKVSRNATNNLGLSLVEIDESMQKQNEASATVRLGNEQGVIKFDTASAGAIPGAGMAPPPMARPAMPMPAPIPNQQLPNNPTAANVQPNAINRAIAQPGVVPPAPGPAVSPNGQIQAPGQEQMPPPRVIRRRAIIPAAPSAP